MTATGTVFALTRNTLGYRNEVFNNIYVNVTDAGFANTEAEDLSQ